MQNAHESVFKASKHALIPDSYSDSASNSASASVSASASDSDSDSDADSDSGFKSGLLCYGRRVRHITYTTHCQARRGGAGRGEAHKYAQRATVTGPQIYKRQLGDKI